MYELVSIIIPVYNCIDYLDKCVDSIRSQTYSNLEIILIDDGSSDGSGEKCDYYKELDKRIIVFHQSNSGVSAARNNGKLHATGKYVAFFDADDWIEDCLIEVMINHLTENDADACWSIKIFKDNDGEQILSDIPVGNYESNFILQKHIHGQFMSPTWNGIFKSDVIQGCLYPEDIHMLEDYQFNAQVLSLCKKVNIIDIKLYHYRTNYQSARWSEMNNKKLSCFRIYPSLCDFYNKNKLNIPEDLIDVHIFCVKSIASTLVRYKYDKRIYKEIKNNARKVLKRAIINNRIPINQRICIILCSLSPSLYKVLFKLRIRKVSV